MNSLIPRSTQELILREREKMMNRLVAQMGRMAEDAANAMFGEEKPSPEPRQVVAMEVTGAEIPGCNVHQKVGPSTPQQINDAVEQALDGRLKSLLHDVDYRLNLLYDVLQRAEGKDSGRVGSRDLNLAIHQLDGYTFTNNSPSAGNVAWAGVNIVYKGTNYSITNGNTNNKYIYWLMSAPTILTTSNIKPTLGADDVIVCVNDAGIANLQIVPGKFTHGSAILNGSVAADELANGAVIADKIGALAIIEGKIAANAVTSGKIADSAVTTAKIGDLQVAEGKIAANAVTEAKINNLAVTSGKIASNAVTEAKINTGAVTTTKIADLNITTGKLANSAVDSTKLADSAVTTGKIGDLQVTGPKIGSGAVATDKLNMAAHFLW